LVIQLPSIDEEMVDNDLESNDESGVNIILQPYDDVSSIGDWTMMTQARMDPDGYTSDELYTVSASNPASVSAISGGEYCRKSSILSTIGKKNIQMESSQTSKTMQYSKQKIDEP
jgi:hypothetical protein